MNISVKNITKAQAFHLFMHFTAMAVQLRNVEKEMAPVGLKFAESINKNMDDILRQITVKHLRNRLEFMTDEQFSDVLIDSNLMFLLPFVISVDKANHYTTIESNHLKKLAQNEKRNN